ncbi:MAG: hypothetical protein R3E13_00480 [Alphaproteobacteria bacterium]
MAATTGEGLSSLFNLHSLHTFMMAGMTVSALALSAAATGLPISPTDIAAAFVDAGWQMIAGLEHLPTLFENLTFTDWDLSYEWGAAAHHHVADAVNAGAEAALDHAGHTGHGTHHHAMPGV